MLHSCEMDLTWDFLPVCTYLFGKAARSRRTAGFIKPDRALQDSMCLFYHESLCSLISLLIWSLAPLQYLQLIHN